MVTKNEVRFTVPGEPVGKGRPRTLRRRAGCARRSGRRTGRSRLLYASLMELKPCVIRLTCPDRRKRLEDIGEDWDKD